VSDERLARWLAGLLSYGTGLASIVTASGLGMAWLGARAGADASLAQGGQRAVTAGIAMFVLLPVARVVSMLVAYVARRELRLALVAALVLAILALGVVAGVRLAPHGG
jgi:hypothetical protein